MKQNLDDLRKKIELFLTNTELSEEQRVAFQDILEAAGKFRTSGLIIEEKTFESLAGDLIVNKFLFTRYKGDGIAAKIEKFILDFFFLMFPEVDRNGIKIEVTVTSNGVKINKLTDLTDSLFATIIKTNIIN